MARPGGAGGGMDFAGALQRNLIDSVQNPAPLIQRGQSQLNEFLIEQQMRQRNVDPQEQVRVQGQQLQALNEIAANSRQQNNLAVVNIT